MQLKQFIAVAGFVIGLVAAQSAVAGEVHNYTELIIGDTPGETFTIDADTDYYQHADIGIVGDGTLTVNGRLFLTGHMYVAGSGTLIVDGGEFHIQGNDTNIYVGETGRAIFQNGAFLHYVQSYVAQHNIIMWGSGSTQLDDTTVDCDGSIEFIYMTENSSYSATSVTYNHWKTWYLWDSTTLSLENVNIAGDIVFYDTPAMSFTNTNVIMPWLYFGSGAVIDYEFPQPANPDDPMTMTFDSSLPGVSGIPWSLTLDNCRYIAWGITPYPGSDVTVRNSDLAMIMYRFTGTGTFDLQGIMVNDSSYTDTTVPVTDRSLRLIGTHVNWWKVDVVDDFELTADSIVFSEMVTKNNAKAHLTNSTCEGQTIHLGALDDSYIHFKGGEVWSYVSVWTNATLILENSLVDWEKGQYIYQTSNIAHNNARLYCLNSNMKCLPEAYDSALAMFASIDAPQTGFAGFPVQIPGSAWIAAGPDSSAAFDHYELAVAPEGTTDWTVIENATIEVHGGTLGTWDTAGLTNGNYTLRLTVWVSGYTDINPPENYPAYGDIELVTYIPPRKKKGGCALGDPDSGNPWSTLFCALVLGLGLTLLRRKSGVSASDLNFEL